jgi:hypothetical protein
MLAIAIPASKTTPAVRFLIIFIEPPHGGSCEVQATIVAGKDLAKPGLCKNLEWNIFAICYYIRCSPIVGAQVDMQSIADSMREGFAAGIAL